MQPLLPEGESVTSYCPSLLLCEVLSLNEHELLHDLVIHSSTSGIFMTQSVEEYTPLFQLLNTSH